MEESGKIKPLEYYIETLSRNSGGGNKMGKSGKMTVRDLLTKLMAVDNIDTPISLVNINERIDESDPEVLAENSHSLVSVNDNSEESSDVILYYLGDKVEDPSDDDDVTEMA